MFRNMKIGARLILSSAVFLVPMGIMFFFVVTGANTSIQSAKQEQRGLSCLRSIAELLWIVSEDLSDTRPETASAADTLFKEMERRYAAIGEKGQRGKTLVQQINSDLIILRDTGWDGGSLARMRVIENLRALFSVVGNNAALFMDTDADDYYFADAGIRILPRSWDRISRIENILRLSQGQTGLSAYDSKTAGDYLTLLIHADYSLAVSDIDAALNFFAAGNPSVLGSNTDDIFSLLASYRSTLDWYIATVQAVLSLNQGEGDGFAEARSHALSAGARAIESSYAVMNACFSKLEVSLGKHIDMQRRYFMRSLGLVVLTSVLAFGIVILSNIHISRSTARLRGLFATLEENDLSVNLPVQARDEFGELLAAFNSFLEKLRAAFNSFSKSAVMISSSAFDLSASAKEISTTANEQSASVAEILSTMEGNKELSVQGAARTQEVAELAVQTQELSRRGAELRDANQDMMGLIRDAHGKIIEEINGLADILTRINESIAIIDSITDQTRLIAFNASLEAAASVDTDAGEEAGDNTRFSVVAAEIRRFADSVVDSTAEIKEQIQELQRASQSLIGEANNGRLLIDQGYERVVRQKEVFEQIVDVSRNVAVRSQQISDLSRQQEYAASQIFTALKEISAGVNQFVTATVSTSKTADNLNVMSVELRDIMAKYRTGKAGPGDR
ncbi:MAG: methyl-accepting chemotaxis protein [Treponema sp.]|jgi:methyl-accepting chemotaxis protein|nr:methyl-accepting chemotaxis protein [Treponema sp.]